MFSFKQGGRTASTTASVPASGQQAPQQQQQQQQGSKRSRAGEGGGAGVAVAVPPVAPFYPVFAPLPVVPPASGDMALLPVLQGIVARHLAAVEVMCSVAGVAQGGAFLEATRAATTALLDSAKQMGASEDSGSGSGSGSGAGSGAGGGNPKNAANRTRLAVLKRQKASYQGEVAQWKGLLAQHRVGGKGEGEEGEEEEGEGDDEELDEDLLKAHLGGEGGSAADGSMALSTLIDLDDIARGVRAVARRMDAMQKGVEGASKELHGAAAASAGAMGSGADPKALLRGLAAGGGGEDFKSPRRLLKDLAGRGGGGGGGANTGTGRTPSSLKRSMRLTPGK